MSFEYVHHRYAFHISICLLKDLHNFNSGRFLETDLSGTVLHILSICFMFLCYKTYNILLHITIMVCSRASAEVFLIGRPTLNRPFF